MIRLRLLLVVLLGVGAGLVLSLGLSGCGSGSERGERVMDLGDLGGYPRAVAVSDQGKVTLAAARAEGEIEVDDLQPDSWSWSEPEDMWSSVDVGDESDDIVAAYDGSGRLLVAWTDGTKVEGLLRAANGKWRKWQRARLIVQLPKKGVAAGLTLVGGKNGFALGWYDEVGNRNVSGFRILRGNKWLPTTQVGAEGSPVQVELFDNRPSMALWILPVEQKLMYASLLPNGKLGKPRVLADANGFLATSFDSSQAIAAWDYKNETWATIWNGRGWIARKRLGKNASGYEGFSPIAAVISRGRAAVAWRTGYFQGGASYSFWQDGRWKVGSGATFPATGATGAGDLDALALPSGEIALLGMSSYTLIAEHSQLNGEERRKQFSIETGGLGTPASASAGGTAVLVWEGSVQASLDTTEQHLFAWVYRP
jgi:hypothetical protein